MKTIVVLGGILLLMCCVIAIPICEEQWHIKNDSTFKPVYELKNNFVPDTTLVKK